MTRTPFSRAFTAAGLAMCISMAATPAMADQDTAPKEEELETSVEMTKGEKRLAKMLEGRVAGEPQTCIRTLPSERSVTFDKTAYVYGRGDTIYVQRTRNPDKIDDRDTLVIQRFGNATQLCRHDIVTTIDPFIGFMTGVVLFDDFVPYTRVDKDEG